MPINTTADLLTRFLYESSSLAIKQILEEVGILQILVLTHRSVNLTCFGTLMVEIIRIGQQLD